MIMKMVIEFDMDNAAFDKEGGYREREVSRILYDIGDRAYKQCDDNFEVKIYDINGNYIGICCIRDI